MSNEFYVEENLSGKRLNHQSTSLVVPQIFRNRVSSSMYYKTNLTPASLRGDTMVQLLDVLVRDFGSVNDRKYPQVNVCGGVEFKCILMKFINIRPSWEQLNVLLAEKGEFNNKYLVAMILCYLRISYHFLNNGSEQGISSNLLKQLMKKHIRDHRKLKSVPFEIDCWSSAVKKEVTLIHMDELVEWLCVKNEIWGIPLGHCTWCDIWDADSMDESSDTSSDEDSE